MIECHRLGIKNFKSIRHPGRIKLAFDLCNDDASAPRSVSSKSDDYHQKIKTSNFNYSPIKKTTNDRPQRYQYLKISITFIINLLYFICRVLGIILKYIICLIWCLFKIFRCTIFRVLTESIRYRPKALICHSIRCSHHHH